MIHYRIVQRSHTEILRIICNRCGTTFEADGAGGLSNCTEVKKVFGYGSKKDGDKYVAHLCEPCIDELFATFKIPPQIVPTDVWGEEPRDPIVRPDPASDEAGPGSSSS